MSAARNQVFLGTFVHSKSLEELEYLHNTAVCVDKQGKIVAVEGDCDEEKARVTLYPKLGWTSEDVSVVTCKEGQFFFPGFIDTHLHASQYPNVGIFGKSTLLDWLNTYTFPLEASLSDPARARRVYSRCVRKTLSHGTTTAAYYATIDVATTNLLADLCLAAGQRALVGRVCMDQLSPDWYRDESPAQAVAAARESIAYIEKAAAVPSLAPLVRPVITPRFAPSCSAELLAALGALHKETGLPVQTHISENTREVDLVRELFPPPPPATPRLWTKKATTCGGGAKAETETETDLGPGDHTYAGVYDRFGLLGDQTILAHAVHLTEAEADLIAARAAKVAHCPCSNSALTSGAARVRWLLRKGVDVGLGTDMSGGYSPSVLEAARQANLVSRHVALTDGALPGQCDEGAKLSVEEVLFLATRGGAKVVGLDAVVGAFAVGMEWDAQLVGLGMVDGQGRVLGWGEGEGQDHRHVVYEDLEEDGNVDVFGWESWEDRVAKWLFNGDDRNTRKVWVRGRLVHERR